MIDAITPESLQGASEFNEIARNVGGQLGLRFDALMTAPMSLPDEGGAGGINETAKAVLSQQNAELALVQGDVDLATKIAPSMNMQQLSVMSMQMAMEMAHEQFDMQVKMSLVNSSKSSAETLMKGQ
jgi:type III secretion inner rod protein HrpB2